MKIFFLYSGPFGEQIINNVSLNDPDHEISGAYEIQPDNIPGIAGADDLARIFEDPDRYVPEDFPAIPSDLLVVLGIHGQLSDLVPPIARKLGVRSVLYPIDDRDTIPAAKKTIEDELRDAGIATEFPEPFCSVCMSSDPQIGDFVSRFGRPAFRVSVDPVTGVITEIEVIRDTPCGSATSIARKLLGQGVHDREALSRICYDEQHNDEADNYCLAEMDPRYPLMQQAGDLLRDALFEACGFPTTKSTIVTTVRESGEIDLNDLAALVVGGPIDTVRTGCITRRSFDLFVDELLREGQLAVTREGKVTPA